MLRFSKIIAVIKEPGILITVFCPKKFWNVLLRYNANIINWVLGNAVGALVSYTRTRSNALFKSGSAGNFVIHAPRQSDSGKEESDI
jgi:hypothetical protein